MALNFPSSPANGATYSGYTYNATKGVWEVISSTITNMTVSDTAPSNPLSGDSWFDSTTGYVFVYYTDADSSQWVQTTGAYIDTALTNRVTTVESRATSLETANSTTNRAGLVPVVPTSVAVGSGSASVAANGIVTFTGVSSISVNGAFSSTYRSYRIVAKYRNTLNNNTTALQMRLRASGSDYATGNWVFSGTNTIVNNAGTVSVGNWGPWGSNLCHFGYIAPQFCHSTMDIHEPNIATPTGVSINASALNTTTGAHYSETFNGGFDSNAVADGFSWFTTPADTFSGTIQIYGYR